MRRKKDEVIGIASVEEARKVIQDAFKEDDGFRDTYVANVACILMDNISGITKEHRDKVAEKIIGHILEDKPTGDCVNGDSLEYLLSH